MHALMSSKPRKGFNMKTPDCIARLITAGFTANDADALRRIAMTLSNWHELECGTSDDYKSWAIVRGSMSKDVFTHDDDGRPFIEMHPYRGDTRTIYSAIPDRERGALRRLASIMARYPGFASYVQTDPRGNSLYILRPDDLTGGQPIDQIYSRGIGVYK
jgi:hypothetical protein